MPLTVTATSSNPGLIPKPAVNYTSPQSTGTLTYTPVANANGTATITVTVNRTRIEQIYVNLVINAVEAIGDDDGTITLRAGSSADGRRALCEVRDTGPGIAPDRVEEIFVPFFTTKGDRGGTGLGLPVAREIVESYGGALRATSEVGKGTAFTFDLPR